MRENTVFVGGISWKADESALRAFFSEYGEVVDCKIIMDRATGKSKGYGFVSFGDAETATRVKQQNNFTFLGKTVNVGDAYRRQGSNASSENGDVPRPGQYGGRHGGGVPGLQMGTSSQGMAYMSGFNGTYPYAPAAGPGVNGGWTNNGSFYPMMNGLNVFYPPQGPQGGQMYYMHPSNQLPYPAPPTYGDQLPSVVPGPVPPPSGGDITATSPSASGPMTMTQDQLLLQQKLYLQQLQQQQQMFPPMHGPGVGASGQYLPHFEHAMAMDPLAAHTAPTLTGDAAVSLGDGSAEGMTDNHPTSGSTAAVPTGAVPTAIEG
eukprot:GFYU01003558.1.p1 GENE.GFYU01003558.1~~GFYU01003558.1.p1  ORF type:complete len:320 (+),score=78.02 GFYU01003558.1:162-1121(+)